MQQAVYYSNKPLQPARGTAKQLGVRLSSNLTLARGVVLAQILATAANEVQSLAITGGTPTSGGFYLNFNGLQTASLPFGATAAQVQTALQSLANIGPGGVLCTGGPLPGSPVTITFAGSLAGLPEPLITVVSSSLNAGTAAVTRTTAGVANKRYVAYDGTLLAAPLAAPTVAGNGSGSAYGAGSYAVSYTLVTASGETTPSPVVNVTVTANQNLRVSAISSLNAAVTRVNFYVDGNYAGFSAVSSGASAQTDLTGSGITVGGCAPLVNSAFANSDGRQIAKGILMYDVRTDEQGRATFGQIGSPQFSPDADVPAYYGGTFVLGDLIGVDTTAVGQFGGRFLKGALGDATSELLIPSDC